uniref:Uncharacterized protein n=1 Tax=Cacopsylla melanoneura TaxID=428564 RepID=A0A8D8V3A4_9HEMI
MFVFIPQQDVHQSVCFLVYSFDQGVHFALQRIRSVFDQVVNFGFPLLTAAAVVDNSFPMADRFVVQLRAEPFSFPRVEQAARPAAAGGTFAGLLPAFVAPNFGGRVLTQWCGLSCCLGCVLHHLSVYLTPGIILEPPLGSLVLVFGRNRRAVFEPFTGRVAVSGPGGECNPQYGNVVFPRVGEVHFDSWHGGFPGPIGDGFFFRGFLGQVRVHCGLDGPHLGHPVLSAGRVLDHRLVDVSVESFLLCEEDLPVFGSLRRILGRYWFLCCRFAHAPSIECAVVDRGRRWCEHVQPYHVYVGRVGQGRIGQIVPERHAGPAHLVRVRHRRPVLEPLTRRVVVLVRVHRGLGYCYSVEGDFELSRVREVHFHAGHCRAQGTIRDGLLFRSLVCFHIVSGCDAGCFRDGAILLDFLLVFFYLLVDVFLHDVHVFEELFVPRLLTLAQRGRCFLGHLCFVQFVVVQGGLVGGSFVFVQLFAAVVVIVRGRT